MINPNVEPLANALKPICNNEQIADVAEAAKNNLLFCLYVPEKLTLIETFPNPNCNDTIISIKQNVDWFALHSGRARTFTAMGIAWKR